MINSIKKIIRENDFSIDEDELMRLASIHRDKIVSENFDFGLCERKILTQRSSNKKKKRIVYSFDKMSTENILCEYIKMKLDILFDIKYSDRKKIIKILFNTLPAVQDLNDFVIIRFDFKSFFDSVSSLLILEEYIYKSSLKRNDKDLFTQFCEHFPYCFAGLQTSNAMTEIICIYFDKVFKSRLSKYGIVYCERYVDDVLVILNKYISEVEFKNLLNESIEIVFKGCRVRINENKFQYISKRKLPSNCQFDFLGYLFIINRQDDKIGYQFGITEAKIHKYKSKIRQSFLDYKKDNDLELFRHRLKLFSCRIVYSMVSHDEYCHWISKGLINNYNELRFHMNSIEPKTKSFMQYVYYQEMYNLKINIPYFMPRKFDIDEESIYNIFSNMRRNRSIVFDEKVGIKIDTLIREIRKVKPTYFIGDKNYFQITKDYLDFLKL